MDFPELPSEIWEHVLTHTPIATRTDQVSSVFRELSRRTRSVRLERAINLFVDRVEDGLHDVDIDLLADGSFPSSLVAELNVVQYNSRSAWRRGLATALKEHLENVDVAAWSAALPKALDAEGEERERILSKLLNRQRALKDVVWKHTPLLFFSKKFGKGSRFTVDMINSFREV